MRHLKFPHTHSHVHSAIFLRLLFGAIQFAPFFHSTFRLSPQRFRFSKISRSGAANWSMLNDYRMWHIYCTTPYNKVTLRGVGEPIYDCELTMPAVKCDMSKSWQQLLVLWAKHYFGWGKDFANKLFDKSVCWCVWQTNRYWNIWSYRLPSSVIAEECIVVVIFSLYSAWSSWRLLTHIFQM